MYCVKCKKEINEEEAKKYNNYCENCYKSTKNTKSKKNLIILFIILALIILIIAYQNFTKSVSSNVINYNVNVEKIGITTLNDDDIFYKYLKDTYKGYKLIFVSVNFKNNTQTNYSDLSYQLVSSNSNTYSKVRSYVTDKEEFLDNYYKINNKIFDDSTDNILGEKNKRVILGFMVSESELTNNTSFTLITKNFGMSENEIESLKFNSSDIIKSSSMLELYKDDELEKAQQTISLAYSTSINDWLGWMVKLEQTYNYKYEDLFGIAFATIHVYAESTDYSYGWNGRKIDTNGSKLDFEKSKTFYPDISSEIDYMSNAINEIKDLYNNYNKSISSLDKSKLLQMDKDVSHILKIKDYFKLQYSR